MSYTKIKDVKVQLYGKCDVHFTANEDVNVIVGVNGSGKTALRVNQHPCQTQSQCSIFHRHPFAKYLWRWMGRQDYLYGRRNYSDKERIRTNRIEE